MLLHTAGYRGGVSCRLKTPSFGVQERSALSPGAHGISANVR
jgi:hypothetical protein